MTNATFTKTKLITTFAVTIVAAIAFSETIRGDGHLNFYYDGRKDRLDIVFRDKQGRPIPSAIEKINIFLRSPDNQSHPIDIQLLDLVDAIQDHFNEPVIEIISAYRSPNYNRGLKDTGHNVANESLHMHGKAMDIHLDTVTEDAVRDYAQSLGIGGVGWYPQNDFVHVDLGEVRTWGNQETSRKWVGLNNNSGPLTIRTNANRYFQNDTILIHVTPKLPKASWQLEKFDHGGWKSVSNKGGKSLFDADFRIQPSVTKNLARGRYRIRIADSLSNEFYLKN
jgi:uncharacterized protein YcbK (DUF882 family)